MMKEIFYIKIKVLDSDYRFTMHTVESVIFISLILSSYQSQSVGNIDLQSILGYYSLLFWIRLKMKLKYAVTGLMNRKSSIKLTVKQICVLSEY
jgi:hypothetical protein